MSVYANFPTPVFDDKGNFIKSLKKKKIKANKQVVKKTAEELKEMFYEHPDKIAERNAANTVPAPKPAPLTIGE